MSVPEQKTLATREPLATAGAPAAGEYKPPRALRLFASCMLTWLIPYAFFCLFLVVADPPAPYDTFPVFDPLITGFVLAFAVLAAGWITHRYRTLLANDAAGAPSEVTRRGVRRVLFSLPWIVLIYLAVGCLMALILAVDLAAPGVAGWGASAVLVTLLSAGIVFTYILLPLGLVCLDEFGVAFGHVLGEEPLVSMLLRTTPGMIMVTMIGAALVLQEYVRTGVLAEASLVLVATMIPYAIVVMLLNMRYTANALTSINRFIEAGKQGRSVAATELRAESLDQIGVMYVHIGELVRQLEESESRLRTFADAASDFYFETDAGNCVTWVSERVADLTGLAPDALLGRSFTALAEDFRIDLSRQQLEYLWTYRPFRDFVLTIPRDHDADIRLRLSAVPAFDEAGLFAGYRGVGTDITRIANAEERLRDREAQLAQAQKMEAVGQLTGGVAHDFNNLLLVVAGNLELARDEDDAEERGALIEQALAAADRGAGLVQHLLAFSRRQVLRPEAFDLASRLDGLRTLLRTTLGERIELHLELGADLDKPLLDAAQFESALLNLAINARDAMPRGGQFRVRASNRRVLGREHGLAPGDYVEVRAEDTGTGMPPDVLERVFEPFFSTKAVGAGSGLGLSMVYGFVTQSRGAIDIASSEGIGTTITLLLPVADETPAPRASAPDAVPRDQRGERILMIEDEPEVRRALTAGLEAAGYEVVSAPDADAGKRLLDAGLKIDLLLSDVVLPGSMSGVELVAELRRSDPELPCLLMSGYTDDHLRDAPPELEHVRLLSKPFRVRLLLEHVDALLEARAQRRPRLVVNRPGPA